MTWQLQLSNYPAYHRLMRMDKPIGIYLLLWPTLWALWIASSGMPHWYYLVIFVTGTVIMRAAGCVINDYADRHVDGHVERTEMRPLPAKQVTETEAKQLFAFLIMIAVGLALLLDFQTQLLAIVALMLAFCYPFMKRYTHYPQVVLGAAFGWSIPMVFMAVQADLPTEMWLLFLANLAWTVAYDTFYAMVDKKDDLKVGIKSTAIAFGNHELTVIAALQALTLLLLHKAATLMAWSWPIDIALVVMAAMFIQQHWWCRNKEPQACFKAFLANHWVGMTFFIGLVVQYSIG